MIPAGRTVTDRSGIAALHGMTWRQAVSRRPWSAPGHPEPITRGRPALWDAEQAAAFARGEAIPPLPATPNPRDLLDRWEAAEYVGVKPTAWEREFYRGRVPKPDAEVHGVPHWYRSTVEAHRREREVPKRGSGRPAGRVEAVPRAELGKRVRDLLREADERGERISVAEVARRIGIHYTTAHRHVTAARQTTK